MMLLDGLQYQTIDRGTNNQFTYQCRHLFIDFDISKKLKPLFPATSIGLTVLYRTVQYNRNRDHGNMLGCLGANSFGCRMGVKMEDGN